tara:strand:+ start:3243 stop:3935 length:693 start_codon:yes stop_codon:yes gene_type:complete
MENKMENNFKAYMPLWVGDYISDTQHLSTLEHGVYLLLLMHYWRNGALTDDKSKLMRITRVSRYKIIHNILHEFFHFKDGKWWNSRLEKEILRIQVHKEKRINSAKIASKARWDKERQKVMQNASVTDTETNATHNHTHNQKEKYIFYGNTVRINEATLKQFLKENKNHTSQTLISEIKTCDEFYTAKLLDGNLKEDYPYGQEAFFKLKEWIKKSNKASNVKTQNIRSAI